MTKSRSHSDTQDIYDDHAELVPAVGFLLQGTALGGEGMSHGCAGLGMNEDELKRNPVLTEWVVKDLNEGTGSVSPSNSLCYSFLLCNSNPYCMQEYALSRPALSQESHSCLMGA